MRRLAFVFASCLWIVPRAALADVVPNGLGECGGREAGDACTVNGSSGACVATTCGRLDYSQGMPPRSVEYACLLCTPGARSRGCAIGGRSRAHVWLAMIAGTLGLSVSRRRARARCDRME